MNNNRLYTYSLSARICATDFDVIIAVLMFDRLVIVTLTCNETNLADSIDSHVIHLAGFDSATPEIIRSFVSGELDSVPAG